MSISPTSPTSSWRRSRLTGPTGGDRSLCWRLACGPLADDNRLRDWVRDELCSPDEHALILYSVALVPDQWSDDPAFARALADYADKQIGGIPGAAQAVARGLPVEQGKAVLLKGLTGFRPQGVAWRLVEEFPDDEDVRALQEFLADDAKAGKIASVAVSVLGTEAGFVRILDLLHSSLDSEKRRWRAAGSPRRSRRHRLATDARCSRSE